MSKVFLPLIGAVFFVVGWGTFQTPSVQIGTWNLGFFTDLNPATGQWCEEHNPRTPKVIEEMAQFLDSLDLEVLALEEVEDAEALDLLLSFMPPGKYAYIVSSQTAPETCQRVAVLYQKEEVAMRYVGEIPLSLGQYGLRDGLVVYGKFLPDGFDFTLVVVHLKAYSDPRSTSIREEQLSLLGQWVQTYLDDPENDRDLIIAGDFNEHLLTNKKAFSLLDPKGLLYLVTKDAPQKRCQNWTDPIDHIVISQVQEYAKSAVFYDFFKDPTLPDRYSYSDHCILWADFYNEDLDP
jgi:endonuclease/exonuclease/phosphatase family metal-dependent hydrolase